MEVGHDDDDLSRIEADPDGDEGLEHSLVRAFRKVMNIVRSVQNESELYHWPSLHFEKLKGKRKHQHSMRLNRKLRLIVEIEQHEGPNSNVCVIKNIEDYH